jgi:hypothetical protein
MQREMLEQAPQAQPAASPRSEDKKGEDKK